MSSNNTNDSHENTNDTTSCDDTEYTSENEAFSDPIPANLFLSPDQHCLPGEPPDLQVGLATDPDHPINIPLCLLINARSIFNKTDNLNKMLNQIGPDLCIISETFERNNKKLSNIFTSKHFESISYFRKNKAPGGGCAIVYNQTRFNVTALDIAIPEGIESCWALFTPKFPQNSTSRVKRIAIGAYYISPRSKYKQETIENIIDSIHTIRAQFDNEINFLIGGDFNRVDVTDVLDSYGALKQIISIPTRQSAILDLVLTDMATLYHPPTTLPPLEVDTNKVGKDGDHNIVVLAPVRNLSFKTYRKKKKVITRPLPESGMRSFEKELIFYPWNEKFMNKSANEKAIIFHDFLRTNLDKFFPEKITQMSNLDKRWMDPQLKHLHRDMQREFYRNRKSKKYVKLRAKFRKLKRKNVKMFYSNFVSELKLSSPAKWYSMAKKIGAVDPMTDGEVKVESLSDFSNQECAQKIAEHFASISNEYSPVDNAHLPCFLPSQPPPTIEEYDIYVRLNKLRKTKSTLPIDIPDKLRQECSPHLAAPLASIYNDCLTEGTYPTIWKQEWVTPAPKISNPKVISDLRKISCTSDYSKIFEGFLKEWIIEDIYSNIDIGQFGGLAGTGTEHMIVCLVDRILKLLDDNPEKSAVIATSLDWAAAFDRQDPTLAIIKFLQLGVRPSLIPILVSYLSDRKIKVKFNGEISELMTLIGGGPQGMLLGGLEYIVQSNDNAETVQAENQFKFIDDLSILKLICLSALFVDYGL